jgi:hypothetical protein
MTNLVDSWKQLIEQRKQTHAWDMDRAVSKEDITELLAELHRRAPVKQNRCHYNISVVDMSDTDFRNKYYEFAVDRDNPDPQFNPQVLAPYMLVFSWRDPGSFAADFSAPSSFQKWLSHLEIGIASFFITHAAAARELDAGYCKCYDTESQFAPEIVEKLGLDSIHDIYLTVGIGYGTDARETLNPHTNKMVPAPFDEKWKTEPKPDMSDYIKFI